MALAAIFAAFTVYRVARMVAEEDGPFFIFKRLRGAFTNDKSWMALGLRCVYCISFWVALPVAGLLCASDGWGWELFPIWWFGLSGIAIKIHEYWKR